uniref:Uncharacterized protein n=1 Tax=Kalanchoe fedtschenkoi TaxID=63787 RepID=A0A7N0US15_KALFE
MATTRGGSQRQPSRLQRRAPASININPVKEWNVAIPLLSPLTSPVDRSLEIKMREQEQKKQNKNTNSNSTSNSSSQGMEIDKPVFKKWQHPAAPFGYDPTSQHRSCIRF